MAKVQKPSSSPSVRLILPRYKKLRMILKFWLLEKFMRIKYVARIHTPRRCLYLHKYHGESQVYSHFGCMFVRNKIC